MTITSVKNGAFKGITGLGGKPIEKLTAPECQIAKTLLKWWFDHKGDDIPSRQALKPSDLKNILPHIYMVDVIDQGREYSLRLHGSALAEMMGVDCTGLRVTRDKNTGKFGKSWRGNIYEMVYKTRAPVFYKFNLGDYGKEHVITENILLPMKDKQGEFTILLCASCAIQNSCAEFQSEPQKSI